MSPLSPVRPVRCIAAACCSGLVIMRWPDGCSACADLVTFGHYTEFVWLVNHNEWLKLCANINLSARICAGPTGVAWFKVFRLKPEALGQGETPATL